MLKEWGGRILESTLEGRGLRHLIMNSESFKTIWADPVKRNQAAEAIIKNCGEVGEHLVKFFSDQMAQGGQSQ
jgi:hypothetical protein